MANISFSNINVFEAVLVFLGLQFAGYSTSRTIEELPIQTNYRLLILWFITALLLMPILLIKQKKDRLTERQINQIAVRIATEVTRRVEDRLKLQKSIFDGETHLELDDSTTPIKY